jgi:hypothetical protein
LVVYVLSSLVYETPETPANPIAVVLAILLSAFVGTHPRAILPGGSTIRCPVDGAGWTKNHLPISPPIIQSMTQLECKKEFTFQEYRILDEY